MVSLYLNVLVWKLSTCLPDPLLSQLSEHVVGLVALVRQFHGIVSELVRLGTAGSVFFFVEHDLVSRGVLRVQGACEVSTVRRIAHRLVLVPGGSDDRSNQILDDCVAGIVRGIEALGSGIALPGAPA